MSLYTGECASEEHSRRRGRLLLRLRLIPRRDWQWLVLLLGVAASLVIRECRGDDFTRWDADHPGVGALVAGALTVLFGLLVIDAMRADLNEIKWQAVSNMSFLVLSRELTLVIDLFIWLGSGRPPLSPIGIERSKFEEMFKLRERRGLECSKDSDYGKLTYKIYNPMVELLVEDSFWCRWANNEVSRSKDSFRQSIVKLLPAMFLNSDAVDILDRAVGANHWMSAIQSHLDRLADPDLEADPRCVSRDWMAFLAEMISLREDLWTISRPYEDAWKGNRRIVHLDYQCDMQARRERVPPERAKRPGAERRRLHELRKLAAEPLAYPKLKVR